MSDIEHRCTKVKTPRINGFIERFNKTVIDDFLQAAFRENFYEAVEAPPVSLSASESCRFPPEEEGEG